ncbi:hypothetical protein ACFLUV_03550 [Elusimicrobiota bacterium]
MSNEDNIMKACPFCGKKRKSMKDSFCPSCGREIFIPQVSRKWKLKVLIIISIFVVAAYTIYLLLKPVIYFNLDKV